MNEDFSPGMGFDERAYHQNGFAQVKYGSDASLYVEFYEKEVFVPEFKYLDPKTGAVLVHKPEHWKKEIFCRIENPGDKLSIWDQPAREKDKLRFRTQWQRFQMGAASNTGTPLKEIREMPRDLEQRLQYYGVHSLEQLAAMHEGQILAMGIGARELQAKAIRRLNEKVTEASREKLIAESKDREDMKARLEQLEKQNQELQEALKSVAASKQSAKLSKE
jgi:hypothetical protein